MHHSQSYTSPGTENPRDRRRHDATVAAEVDKLERNLRELGPMPKERLADLTGADRWREGTFEEAVAAGVRQGRLKWLAFSWLKATRGARL
jgi:hypothetical protein